MKKEAKKAELEAEAPKEEKEVAPVAPVQEVEEYFDGRKVQSSVEVRVGRNLFREYSFVDGTKTRELL